MKKLYISILLCVGLSVSSCFKLDQDPYDYATDENLFQTLQDAQYAVNGIYAALRNQHEGEAMYATDIQADYLNMSVINPQVLPEIHRWADFSSSNSTTANIWRNYFLIIQNVNIDLEGFNRIPNEPALDNLRAQLYLTRAFCYTYLVTHYCEAYDTARATAQLGLPLTTKQVVKDFPVRSNLKETYDFILADIERAQPLLTSTPTADIFTADAAQALKARVLLYQNNWTEAYTAAKTLIDGNKYPLVSSARQLQAIWANDNTSESITQLHASTEGNNSPELPTGSNYIYLNRVGMGSSYYPNVVPTQSFIDLFDDADYRKTIFLTQQNVSGEPLYLVNKYPANEALTPPSQLGFTDAYNHRPKLLRIAETYLIAAEAAYRNSDETNALTYLNALRNARGLASVTASGETLFAEIQKERNRELCFEGFRLTDLKRWGLGVVRGTPQNLELIITRNPEQYYQLNIAPNYYKMVWPLPPTDVQNEQGRWQQNPNW